ncbi:MAG TPA: PASTA domain-containing protein [Terracidiphilus sp.]|jgi:beta-lactam-binding protein with PASTA domain|nr:PASTA domain-containing protein [Terracidiphilus sp.]
MNSRSIVNFFRVASLLTLLVAVALLAAITTMHFAIHGAEVDVPSLKGMTVADARSVTAGLGLNLNVDNRYYSGDVAAGHILTQSPPPGTVVRREWQVRVSESLGPQKVDVPDIVGLQQRVAELQLRRVGLEVGTAAHLPTAKAATGTVLAQDPPAHAQDIAQPTVSLLVAAPDDETPDGYVMPNLVGLPVLSAEIALTKVGIKSATPVYESVPVAPVGSGNAPPVLPIKPGSVIAQTPAAGARMDQSTIVKLTAAK